MRVKSRTPARPARGRARSTKASHKRKAGDRLSGRGWNLEKRPNERVHAPAHALCLWLTCCDLLCRAQDWVPATNHSPHNHLSWRLAGGMPSAVLATRASPTTSDVRPDDRTVDCARMDAISANIRPPSGDFPAARSSGDEVAPAGTPPSGGGARFGTGIEDALGVYAGAAATSC